MPNFVEVPDVAVFSVVQKLHNQNMINNYHVKKEGGWTSQTLADISNVFISWYNDHAAQIQANNVSYVIVRARDLTVSDGAVSEINFPPGSGGDQQFTANATNLAMCIKHTTGLAGKSRRGRTYFGGIRGDALSQGAWLQGQVDLAVAKFDILDGLLNAAGVTWGVVSLYSGYTQSPPKYKKVPTPRAQGIFSDIINNSSTTRVCTQNRRLVGHGD